LPRQGDWAVGNRTPDPFAGDTDSATATTNGGSVYHAGTAYTEYASDDDTQTVVMPVVRGGLTRRVPGATIRMDQPAATRQNVAPQDPDEVWDLVQQFESGVARALHEVRSEPTEEDATR
jgi:hypothetical protein